jgi:ribosomal protein S18 acetylase RimI-like enzyme
MGGSNLFRLLPPSWKTERLIIEDLTLELVPKVQELYEASKYIGEWDGNLERKPDYIMNCFIDGDLPPNGIKDKFKIQTIKRFESIIGYITIYHGFPHNDTVYVAFMYLEKSFQKQGNATEVIKGLINELKHLNYRAIRLSVALKNWSAIRFWFKSGFTSISGIHGDEEYSKDTYSNLELELVIK